MMEWRLANLQGEYKQKMKKDLSYRIIAEGAGLSKTTVAAIANGQIRRPDEDTMNALLAYLSRMLNRSLTTDDLWHYVPDQVEP